MKIFIVILFSLFVFTLGIKPPISYNAKANQKHLDIHIIAHTHDDVGWLKTVDEYFIGAKQSIQNAGVQYILQTVIKELATDPNKKFSYVEIAYFYRYWNECTEDEKNQIRQLVKNGQLEFVNAGWCMNDEANTHLEGNTEQMTRGHEFLVQEVGVDPSLIRTGWQLDPFGHSSEYAVLNTKIGFNSLFFARVDFQDYQNRKQNKQLEFVWRPSVSAGRNTEIFAHILWDTTYCYPTDFAFEWGDTPVQDDPRLFNENVEQRANQFAALMREREQYYVTDQIFVTYGCDFNYQNFMNYRNMDKLIKYINNNPSVYNMTLFYSTPSIYTKAIYQKNLTWTVKTDDFFPYRDNIYSCWSGYFTSRPALKAYVRTRENLLYSTYKLVSSSNSNVSLYLDAVDVGRRAVGVAQHHDAIAGTEKQAVAFDYAERLSIGTQSLYTVWDGVLNDMMKNQQNSNSLTFSFCDHLNISVCPNTQQLAVGSVLPLVLYNAIGFTRTEYVRLPVPTQSISVLDANGSPVATQFVTNDDKTSPYILIFSATLPPMGFSTFFIQRTSNQHSGNFKPSLGQPYILENQNLKVQFSENSGKLNYITNKKSGVSIYVEEDIQWYLPSVGDQYSSQASGAYIFRPDLKSTITINQTPSLVQINGPVVSEVRQYYANWAYQTIRLYTDADFLEFETTIGPIPINDGYGKEVITRFKTNISSNNEWWTDSEGAELMYRKKNFRQTWNFTYVVPVTGNYVPVNEVALIKDQTASLAVVVDRSRGGCSDEIGELEFMNHRRLLVDDGRGVGEPLNETEAIRTTTNVIVEPPALSSQMFRKRSLYLTHPVVYAFANTVSSYSQFRSTYKTSYQGLSADLPPNVHLQTFRAYGNGKYLFRLRHLFGVGEDQNLSKPVVIDVSSLFAGRTVISMQETQLTGIIDINQVDRYQWQTVNEAKTFFPKPKDNAFTVTLNPLDLRTWIIQLQ